MSAPARNGMRHACHRSRFQSGTVLLLGLLVLAALSLLGLAAAADTGLHQRMAANHFDDSRSQQAAQRSLRWAEQWLLSLPGTAPYPPCPGQCGPVDYILGAGLVPRDAEQLPPEWWQSHAHAYRFDPASGLLLGGYSAFAPGYWLIEEVHLEAAAAQANGRPQTSYFRILAMGQARPEAPPVVLESLVARPWGDAAWQDALPPDPEQPAFCLGLTPDWHCGRLAWQRLR